MSLHHEWNGTIINKDWKREITFFPNCPFAGGGAKFPYKQKKSRILNFKAAKKI